MPSFRPLAGLAFGLAFASALAAPAAAQDASIQQEQGRLRRGGEVLDTVAQAGEQARDLALVDDAEVSYADVLADPDDIPTSLRWARHQVREGQLRGAAATLERILILRSDLVAVRLLYAVVLYRLDSLSEAGRELSRLADGPLSAGERAEVERYQRQVRQASRRTRIDGSLAFGTQYETNRNSAPASGTRMLQLGDTRLELDVLGDSLSQDDVAFFGLAQIGFEHDLGFHEGHSLRGSFSTYLSQQDELGDFNTRAYATELGGRYRSRWLDVTPMIFGSIVELSSETFLKNVGLDVTLEREDTPRRGFRGGLRVEWQDFDPVRHSVTSNEHTGIRVETGVGVTFRPATVHQLDADLLYAVKDARGSSTPSTNDVFSHDGPELLARHTWLLGAGRFLVTELLAGRDSYWRSDWRITTKRRRRDVRARASMILGVPVESLLPGRRAPAGLSGLVLSLGVTHQRTESNIPNYEYEDTKLTLVFSRQWTL